MALFRSIIGLVFVLGSLCEDPGTESEGYAAYEPKNVHFYENFDDWSAWHHSSHEDFQGRFEIGTGSQPSLDGEVGLIAQDEAKKYGFSTVFDSVFDTDKDLVFQYELRLHEQLQCGGAYLKLIRQVDDVDFDPESFTNETPFSIMFGPDRCGGTNKVHFIFKYQNPVSKEWHEHHLKSPPSIRNDRQTHLYTLIIRTDNTFEVLIDQESERGGSLFDDFEPPINPPKIIDDPNDEKPEDWIEEDSIPDPEAEKPEDWDEDAPRTILDEEAEKPDDWYEDEEDMIPDPEAKQPDDWDTDADGDWDAPLIENPICVDASGCGPWTRPSIPNPEYKGLWSAPMIDNPEYKGIWAPAQIDNVNWFETSEPHRLQPIVGVGIDIWTMQANVEFDNIFIGHDIEAAKDYAMHTFVPKQTYEAKMKPESSKDEPTESFFAPLTNVLEEYGIPSLVTDNFAFIIATLVVGVLSVVFLMCRSGSKASVTPSPSTAKDDDAEEEEQTTDSNKDDSDERKHLEPSEKENSESTATGSTTQARSAETTEDSDNADGDAGSGDEHSEQDDAASDDDPFLGASTGLAAEEEADRSGSKTKSRAAKSKRRRRAD